MNKLIVADPKWRADIDEICKIPIIEKEIWRILTNEEYLSEF